MELITVLARTLAIAEASRGGTAAQ
jgi:hypothetical protein